MEHFGTVEVSGSALVERLDPLAAVARLRRLRMARGSQAPLIIPVIARKAVVYCPSGTSGQGAAPPKKTGDPRGRYQHPGRHVQGKWQVRGQKSGRGEARVLFSMSFYNALS
jgi:hypothetical protein